MSTITHVTGSAELVDSLLWDVQVHNASCDGRERIFLAKWIGGVTFLRSPTASPRERLTLPATWDNEHEGARSTGTIDRLMRFRSALPGDALARLEAFRKGGRLFTRLDGRFQIFFLGPYGTPLEAEVDSLLRAYRDSDRVLWLDLRTEVFEVPRDLWLDAVLRELRPPGRVLLECSVPPPEPGHEPAAQRALDHLERAQAEFDNGRYDYAADATFKALEALQSIAGVLEARYCEFVKKRITAEVGALSGLANEVRHDEARMSRPTSPIDRALALHLLVASKSLAAVVLQPPER